MYILILLLLLLLLLLLFLLIMMMMMVVVLVVSYSILFFIHCYVYVKLANNSKQHLMMLFLKPSMCRCRQLTGPYTGRTTAQ